MHPLGGRSGAEAFDPAFFGHVRQRSSERGIADARAGPAEVRDGERIVHAQMIS